MTYETTRNAEKVLVLSLFLPQQETQSMSRNTVSVDFCESERRTKEKNKHELTIYLTNLRKLQSEIQRHGCRERRKRTCVSRKGWQTRRANRIL